MSPKKKKKWSDGPRRQSRNRPEDGQRPYVTGRTAFHETVDRGKIAREAVRARPGDPLGQAREYERQLRNAQALSRTRRVTT